MMNRKIAFVWIFSILFCVTAQDTDLFEGDACRLHNGNYGVCKSLTTCDWLHQKLENKSMKLSQIVQCSFKEFESIVCCAADQTVDRIVPVSPPTNEILIFKDTTNKISKTTEASINVPSDRSGNGEKIAEACRKYTKLAVPLLTENIIFGREAHLAEYPHMAALGYPNAEGGHDFDCGGTLISDQWVVTAAHCVTIRRPPTLIRMGVVFLDEDDVDPVDRTIIQKFRHPSYKAEFKQNDIALLQLDRPVLFSDYARPACIRTQLEDVSDTTELIITGWGSISEEKSQRPPVLQQANVTIVPLASCNTTLLKYNERANHPSLRNGLLDSQLCALDTTSAPDKVKDACVGDSGGPIFTYNSKLGVSTLVGVVSFGVSCSTHLPSVYTRVASYIDWIESVVWSN